jgi:hypothetical protein
MLAPLMLSAQVTLQPTPAPTVTAENEPWFLSREPINLGGSLYYPTGPQVFFDRNEMVRSGFYGVVPLYAKTTVDPYNILYVPLPGGLMQPYERRRSGELAGSVGNTAPSFPVDSPSNQSTLSPWNDLPQAAGPPTNVPMSMIGGAAPAPTDSAGATRGAQAAATGTSGAIVPRRTLLSASKPEGINAVFVDYDGRRWFSSGHAVVLDPGRHERIGDYRGFAVYAERQRSAAAQPSTIYISVAKTAASMIAPYSLRTQ